MKYIIASTNRPGSNTRKIAHFVQNLYAEKNEPVEIIDLIEIGLDKLDGTQLLGKAPLPAGVQKAVDQIAKSEGLIFVVPEYNGGMPGALKLFIDHWKFPESFEGRACCFIGLGAGMWGGLRPIEHLSQIMAYRNAYLFPTRVFMREVNKLMSRDVVTDDFTVKLMKSQVEGFQKFCRALKSEGLDANSLNSNRK